MSHTSKLVSQKRWRDKNREKMYEYTNNRRVQLRIKYLNMLGGKCVECGESELKQLEFDHIDPSAKEFNIHSLIGGSEEKILKELSKCQLLCVKCHIIKTGVVEHGGGKAGKWNCKCNLCVDKQREYRESRQR